MRPPPDSQDKPAPRWLMLLLGGGAFALVALGALLWSERGSALVLDLANFFCL